MSRLLMECLSRNPLLSPRPKTLRIHMGSRVDTFFQQPEAPKPRTRSFLKRIGQSITNWTTRRKSKAGLELIPTILPTLTGIMKLSIIYQENDPPSHETIIFAELWKVFGDRLRSLYINSSIANLSTFLTASLRLPSLEIFFLDARSADPHEVLPTTIVLIPFLIAHQSSLRQISIRARHPHDLEISSILQCLQGMPCLYSIGISVPTSSIPFNGHDMLIAHQQSLTSFALYLPSYSYSPSSLSAFFSQDWCYLRLPNLRDLTIQKTKPGPCKEFFDYIQLFASSLVTLTTFPGPRFSYKEAEKLSRKLADFRSLRHLTLGVRGLSPSTLACFAQALPGLSHLVLSYHYISVDGDEHPFEVRELPALVSSELDYNIDCIYNCSQFSSRMRSYADLFSHWELESFDFGADMAALSNAKIKKALIDNLPNVVWFCHVEREECIRKLRQLRFIMSDSGL